MPSLNPGHLVGWLGVVLLSGFLVSTSTAAQGVADPEQYDLNYVKGIVAFEDAHYGDAIRWLAAALAAKPGDADAAYYLGESYLRLQRLDDAAGVFEEMHRADPESGRAQLGLGMVAYHRQQYDAALNYLTAAQQALPEDALVHFYLGLVYHAREDFDRSPARFLRAMALSRDLAPSAQYYTGIALFRRGIYDEAQDALREVIESVEPDSEMARSARRLLEQIKAVAPTSPKRWDLIASANLQYDSNVVLLPLGTQPPGGTTGISHKDDVRHSLYGRGEYRFIQTDRWSSGLSYGVYKSWHGELSRFDVEDHTPMAFVQGQLFGPVQGRLQYSFDYVNVGEAPYLLSHSVLPSVTINEGGRAYTQIQVRYQHKDFRSSANLPFNSLRDGTNSLTGVTQYFLFANNTGSVRIGYAYDRDRTGGGTVAAAVPGQQSSADWPYDGHLLSAGLSIPPRWTIRLDLAFDYYHQQYRNPNSFSSDGLTRRRDNIYFVTATATKDLTAHLSAGIQFTYTRDQNTISVFDYNRKVFSVMLIGHF